MNLVLVRIDDRLIHGQVMTAWVKHTQANRIVIVDDGVANDPFMAKVVKMAAPPGITVDVYDVPTAGKVLCGESRPGEKVIVLVKYPSVIDALHEAGVTIEEVVVGGMVAAPGRKQLYRNISASQEERGTFRKLIDSGIKVVIRIVPDDKAVDVAKMV